MWRVSFILLPNETPLQALRRWYFTSTPQHEMKGDVALHPFDENVVPIPIVDGYMGPVAVPLSHMNPYESSFFLFYMYSKYDITVLGGLTWPKMHELGGEVLISPEGGGNQLIRNRAFPLVGEVFLPPAPRGEGTNWWIPVDLPRAPGIVNQINGTMDDIIFRLLWMLGRKQYAPNREDSVSPLALGIFECTIKDADKRTAFHALRMAKEKLCFEEHLGGLGEEDWVQLLKYNGLEEYMNEAMVDKPTNEDLFGFWSRSTHPPQGGGLSTPPSIIFKVPLEECPPSLRTMPVYTYALIHLTYKELHPWLWHLFLTQSQKLAVKKWDYYSEEDRWLSPLHEIFDKVTIGEINALAANAAKYYKPHGGSGNTTYINHRGEEREPAVLDVDIEDILAVAPPCVAHCISATRFPLYQQRIRLLPIFQTAGIPKERVMRWFERKNGAFPKSGHSTLKSRFDAEALWNARRGPTFCGNIVRDASPNTLHCPYAGDKRACAPDQPRDFAGPHDLIQRRILNLPQRPEGAGGEVHSK